MADNATRFIQHWTPILKPYADKYGINVNYLITQLGHESLWGEKLPVGSNNYGGIIETNKNKDAVTAKDADTVQRFKKFNTEDDFAKYYVDLLARRWPGVKEAKSIEEFGDALKKGTHGLSYAQNPVYANALSEVYQGSIVPRVGEERVGAPAGTPTTPDDLGRQPPANQPPPPQPYSNSLPIIPQFYVDPSIYAKIGEGAKKSVYDDLYKVGPAVTGVQPQRTVTPAYNPAEASKQYKFWRG